MTPKRDDDLMTNDGDLRLRIFLGSERARILKKVRNLPVAKEVDTPKMTMAKSQVPAQTRGLMPCSGHRPNNGPRALDGDMEF